MKTLILSMCLMASLAFAEKVVVETSDLPPAVLEQIQAKQKLQQVKDTVTTVKDIAKDSASIGKEIGVAVNEGLMAVTDNAARFADSTPGKFTMAMIAWKVMGADGAALMKRIVNIPLGICYWTAMNCLLMWLFKRTTRKQRRIVKATGDQKENEEVWEDTWFTKPRDINRSWDGLDYARVWFTIFWSIAMLLTNIAIPAALIF